MFSRLRRGVSLIALIGKIIRIRFSATDGYVEINGKRIYAFETALTDNVTVTTAPVGSLAFTTHATGRMNVFVADGEVWQALGSTVAEAE